MPPADSQAIRDKYRASAAQYTRRREQSIYWRKDIRQMVFDYLQNHPTEIVLDIGCGSGFLIQNLAPLFPKTRFIGVDFCPEFIRIAEASGPQPNVSFVEADIVLWSQEWLQNKSDSMENILCLVLGMMESCDAGDKTTKAIRDLWLGIRSGGLLITFHNQALWGRALFRNQAKRYWLEAEALRYFSAKGDIPYFFYQSFALFDILASENEFAGALLLTADNWISKLPLFILKRIDTTLGLLIKRG